MKVQRLNSILVCLIGGLLAIAGTMSAQDTNTTSTNSTRRAERRGQMVQQRVDRLTTELKLTDDQKAKVSALLQKQARERREMVADTNLPREQRREKMRALMEDENKQLRGILTSDQFEKWQKMREQMREQMRARRPGNPGQTGGPAPAPAPEPKNPDKKAE